MLNQGKGNSRSIGTHKMEPTEKGKAPPLILPERGFPVFSDLYSYKPLKTAKSVSSSHHKNLLEPLKATRIADLLQNHGSVLGIIV